MSAINYSKWDDLEISDDSDIECHPNVDKRSMIRWKQEQIHRERDARRTKIVTLKHEADTLKKQLDRIEKSTQQADLEKKYNDTLAQLSKLELIENKKLTSDKLVTGFDKTAVTKAVHAPKDEKPVKKVVEKTKVIETLNPGSTGGVPAAKGKKAPAKAQVVEDVDSDSEDDVEVTEVALGFSRIKGLDASLAYISKHPYLGTQKYSDEIMAQAFKAQMDGDEAYANTCVHQALILQYCAQLGKDGVGLFFHRIRDPGHPALKIFQNDWKDTYTRIKERCKVLAQERAVMHEIFAALPEDFQEAILSGSLDNVNKSLEGMSVQLAEEVVRVCNQVGFLSIEGDIIDTIKGETIEDRQAEMAAAAAAAASTDKA
ncbi:hsp90 co-chaperone Cdc37 [Mortierella sp. AD031]|nr:hsp90 co-chaperone Cdc37 [Mortierella sp. AD031]